MANDYAPIRRDLWADEDFGDLPALAQWLYLHVVTSPSLSYCGVSDWRPARIAARTSDLDAGDVERIALDLEVNAYLVIDRDTEEALVRSWVKHDGLMGKWNMAAAMARTYAEVVSRPLRGVIVHELKALRDDEPDLRGWAREDVERVLRKPSLDPTEARGTLLPNPTLRLAERSTDRPTEWGNGWGADRPTESRWPTTATSTSPDSRLPSPPHSVPSPGAAS